MKTYESELKTHEKEMKDLETKSLKIGLGYTFKRLNGNLQKIKVIGYDNDFVQIEDADGSHFVPTKLFNTDNFKKDNQ